MTSQEHCKPGAERSERSKTKKMFKKKTLVSQTSQDTTLSFDPDAGPSVSENASLDNDPVGAAVPTFIPLTAGRSGSSAKTWSTLFHDSRAGTQSCRYFTTTLCRIYA